MKIISAGGSEPAEFDTGAKVPVLYDPRNPTDAEIDTFWRFWGLPAIFGGLGLMPIVVGLSAWALGTSGPLAGAALLMLVPSSVPPAFAADPTRRPQESDQVLVENPSLTKSMVDGEIAVSEFFFEIKLPPQQNSWVDSGSGSLPRL